MDAMEKDAKNFLPRRGRIGPCLGYLPDTEPAGDLTARLRTLYGFIPRVFRVQGPIGDFAEQQAAFLEAVLVETHLPRRYKEVVLLTVAATRGSQYGVALHEQVLALTGAPPNQASRIADGEELEGPEGALVRFARKLMLAALRVEAGDIAALRDAGFDDPQIVEIVVLIGFGHFFATMQQGTGAEPDFRTRPLAPQPVPLLESILHPNEVESRPTIAEPLSEPDPDAEWVRRVQDGEIEAFEVLVERHTRRVYRTLVALLGDPEEARDAVQDTFLKAFRSVPAFGYRARFSTWLITIATNTGVQRLRERRSFETLDDGPDSNDFRPRQIRAWGDDPEQACSDQERRTLVERAIAGLPAKYRVVLMLRDVEQMSTKDAAHALGLGIPALKARLLRARLMLREALAPHFSQKGTSA